MEMQDRVRNVEIQLHSAIRHPGQEQEVHELNLKGQLIEKSGKKYLKYEEQLDGQSVLTTVRLGTEEALILRSGAVTMRLPFISNGEKAGNYGSGLAAFNWIVKTTNLDHCEEAGRFHVAYELHAEGNVLGIYELTITYMEGKQ